MEWNDRAVVLSARPHGEAAAIVDLMTREHGRHAGLVHGGRSTRMRGVLEPGTLVAATWYARLSEHLGRLKIEPIRHHAAAVMDDAGRLSALTAACAVVSATTAERHPHPEIFDGLCALLDLLGSSAWAEAYARWELALLGELGFPLDLSTASASGNDYPAHVSVIDGRTKSAAEERVGPTLPLPAFLLGRGPGGASEVSDALTLTGHFIERHLLAGPLPPARVRLADRFRGPPRSG